MPQSKEQLKRKTEKIVENNGSLPLAHLQATMEVADKLHDVIQAIQSIPKPESMKLDGIEMIKGDKGEKGDTGEKGDKGDQGIQGIAGLKGPKGDKGDSGKNGKDGRNGLDGLDGIDGKDGQQGSPDTRDQIIDKINTGGDKKIQAVNIIGLPDFTREVIREIGTIGQVETPLKAGSGVSITTDSTGAKVFTATGSGGTVTSVSGTTDRITVATGTTTPVIDIAATYVGQSSITTLGTIATGTWQATSIATTYTDAKIKTVTGTLNRLTVGGTATDPTFDISTSYVGQATITTLGTITTGVWNGTAIANANLANSTISGIALGGTLGALTATNSTLTFSGTYDGSTARTIGLNLSNANTWTALQTISLTTIQQILQYNASNRYETTVASTGSTTFNLVGTSPTYTWNVAGSNIMTLSTTGALVAGTSITASTNLACAGSIQSNSTIANANFGSSATTNGTGSNTATNARLLVQSATTMNYRAIFSGSGNTTIGVGNSYGNVIIGGSSITIAASGTHALFASQIIRAPAITAGAGALTNAATLYIDATPTGATNNYGFWNVGSSRLDGKITSYSSVVTTGWGVPAIYGTGRSTAQTAAVASVATYTVGAADGSFEVSANVLVTTSTTHSFTVTCAYTDEGNTARTLTLNFSTIGGVIGTTIANAAGAVPYEGVPLHIRCKASTTITIATTGTFTSVTYNVESIIKQTA